MKKTIECSECGENFTATYGCAKYCGPSCRLIAQLKQQAGYRANAKELLNGQGNKADRENDEESSEPA